MINMNDHYNLNGRTCLITGAAGLLGREHCHALAAIGANVVVTDVNKNRIDDLTEELKAVYPSSFFVGSVMDVSSEESVRSISEELKSNGIHVSILINNAAIDPKVNNDRSALGTSTRLESYSIEMWNAHLNVGLTGAFLCSKVFGLEMAYSKSPGVILNIASDLSVIAPDQRIYQIPDLSAEEQPVKPVTYSVVKSGLVGLTKYISTYWASNGIRCNSLSPGGVYNGQPEDFVQEITHRIPLSRMARPDEYRSTVQYLCSDASSYMTGQNIVVDGGRSVW